MTTNIEQLKSATAELHARMERLPFFPALADGSLAIDSYVNQLRAFAVLFATLERTVDSCGDVDVANMYAPLAGRYSHLLGDLDVFAEQTFFDVPAAVQASLSLAQHIRQLGTERPRLLIGAIYTFGGTILGNRVHLPDVRRILGGEGEGDAFYTGFKAETDDSWREFAALLNAVVMGDDERQEMIRVTQDVFAGLLEVHVALHPLPKPGARSFSATALNPEAGNHPVPQDRRELAAALIAGRRCREEFPYFDARYGERGRRYTSSDVAWLVTLADLELAGLVQQVTWLGDLLARLGMPKILLERQLELLVDELVRNNPEKAQHYQKLLAGRDALRQARLNGFSESDFVMLSRETDERLAHFSSGLTNLGALIISALADERSGIAEAAAKLEAWLVDADRFSPGMSVAVRETFRRLRLRSHR